MKRLTGIASVFALAAAGMSVPANAVIFNLIPATGAAGTGVAQGTQARQGFEIAAAYWSSVLKDNFTINLTIGYATLGTGILGSTGSTRSLLSMNQYYTALAADTTSTLDARAVAALPTLTPDAVTGTFGAVTALANGFANGTTGANGYTTASSRLDNDGSVNNATLAVTKANAKALGITTDVNGAAINYATSDASITFSSAFAFDFDPTDGIAAGSYDFIGIAIHEIGHALGFISGVDSYDSKTAPGQTTAASLTSTEGFVTMDPLDLFRYSATSTAQGVVDWRTGGTSYFSLDKGATQLFGASGFSTGTLNGDGRQASHWKDSASGVPQLGILDPTAGAGQLLDVTALDIAAFDVIGYNTSFDAALNPTYRFSTAQAYRAFAVAVPEPATWGMMILGFGMLGGTMRYRRRDTKVSIA